MHDRLSELLEVEVVGEVVQVGSAFFDIGHGRVCLSPLDVERVRELSARVVESFDGARVVERLNLDDAAQLRRGVVELRLRDPEKGNTYLLEITSAPVVALYERRFVLGDGVVGDLMATVVNGLAMLLDEGVERPLRLLSGYDELRERFVAALEDAVGAAVGGGTAIDSAAIADLGERVRRAWRLVPHRLRAPLVAVTRPAADRIVRHDRSLRRTIIWAANVSTGETVYHYVHRHNPYEEYDQVLGWMTSVHSAVVAAYPPPQHVAAMVRASSVERFLEHFPGYQQLIGPPYLEEIEGEQ